MRIQTTLFIVSLLFHVAHVPFAGSDRNQARAKQIGGLNG